LWLRSPFYDLGTDPPVAWVAGGHLQVSAEGEGTICLPLAAVAELLSKAAPALHIFEAEVNWIVAHTQAEARDLYCVSVGETPSDAEPEYDDPWCEFPGRFLGAWEQLDDRRVMTLRVTAAGKIPECGYSDGICSETRTCSEWAARFGLGYLWTSEC